VPFEEEKVNMPSNSGMFEIENFVMECNDLILQARKARFADPAHGGDIAAALSRIMAKAIIAAVEGDAMFPREDGAVDASRVPGSIYRHLQSGSGHLATFALSPSDQQAIDGVIAEILVEKV
jgi:homoserine acetyltransferase